MNKSEIIDFTATLEDVSSKAAAKRVIDAVFEKVVGAIVENGSVSISGLGTFHTVERGAREGRNPQTGAPIAIPAKDVVKFRPSGRLKEAVNA